MIDRHCQLNGHHLKLSSRSVSSELYPAEFVSPELKGLNGFALAIFLGGWRIVLWVLYAAVMGCQLHVLQGCDSFSNTCL